MSDQQISQPTNANKSDVQLGDLLSLFFLHRKLVVSFTAFFAFSALLFAFMQPNIYQSASIFEVKLDYDSKHSSGGGSSLDAFSALAGISVSGGSNEMSNLAIATITSRDFLKHLIAKDSSFLPKLLAVDYYDSNTRTLVYDSSKYNSEKDDWLVPVTTHIGAYPQYLKIISVSSSKKTGYVTITISHESPEVAAELISLIYNEANSLIRKRELDEANSSLDYLYSQLRTVNQREVLNSINALITVQLRKLTLANIKKNYLLDPIETPFVPETKVSPKRLIILILGSLIGFILILLSLTIWHYAFSMKHSLQNES